MLAVLGGGPKATALQFGINRAQNGWTLGAAAAYTDNGDGSSDRAIGLALMRDLTDKLQVSGGLNLSHSGLDGADLAENGVSVVVQYSFVPDKVLVDTGLWQIWSDDAGVKSDRTGAGLGISLYL